MNVRELPLQKEFIEMLIEQGVEELYPPQEEAALHIFAGKNVVVSIPTASGKSLIGYLAILRALQEGRKAMYIAPFKAIAVEKYRDLLKLEDFGYEVALGTGDYARFNKKLKTAHVKILTVEKADSMLRNAPELAVDTDVIVLDEIHFLGDEGRGATMEMFITKFLYENPDVQIVGLSATIPNVEDIARWLSEFKDTEVVQSEFRVVPLKVCTYDGTWLRGCDGNEKIPAGRRGVDNLARMILEMDKQVLIFVATRKSARSLALYLKDELAHYTASFEVKMKVSEYVQKLKERGKDVSSTVHDDIECMMNGVAFHHAGLPLDFRIMVEDLFRQGYLKVLVATSTLSAGINLPAFAVIVRDLHRNVRREGRWKIEPLSPNDVLQYLGRAGRPRYDKVGWGIMYLKNKQDYITARRVLREDLEKVKSQLLNERELRRHLLSLIGMNIANDWDTVASFLNTTFYAYENQDMHSLLTTAREQLEKLKQMGFIYEKAVYMLHPLADWIVKTYLDPLTAYIFLYVIHVKNIVDEFALLLAFGASPDAPELSYGKHIGELVEIAEAHGRFAFFYDEVGVDYEKFISGVKVAAVLYDWINEVPIEEIRRKWDIEEGDLDVLRDNATWVLSAVKIILENNKSYAYDEVLDKLHRLYLRVKYGVPPELIDLVDIRYVGRKRARVLYDAGYKSVLAVANADVAELMKLPGIGKKLAEKIIINAKAVLQLRKRREEPEEEEEL